jgi:multiple sugar transport system ATP-binding protein
MAQLTLDHIRKVYNKTVVAIDDTSLEIPDGLIVSLLGPSGCGKTTTMRIIAGFESPDRGKVLVNGRDITRVPPNKRNMSMVFQFPVVYDSFTIYENMAAPLRSAKMKESRIREIISSTSPEFGISESSWNNRASNLSISDRQRLSLAHAFSSDRSVYILDEPFSNIDPKARVSLARYVRKTQQVKRHTIVFVTHSQSEALTLSDRIAVMREGKILQYDTPERIYTKPANKFVGWFLGNPGMNFIRCLPRRNEGGVALEADGFTALPGVPPEYKAKLSPDKNIILGIRPEDVEVAETRTDRHLPARCLFCEPAGSRLLLNLELARNIAINVKVPSDLNISKGDTVFVQFPERHITLFDAKTDEAL